MEDLGSVYNCNLKSWVYNPKKDNGESYYNQKEILKSCSSVVLNRAFDQAPRRLELYARKPVRNYTYLEYDTGPYGLHEKIYSWLENTGKKQSCEKSQRKKRVFPPDIYWNKLK